MRHRPYLYLYAWSVVAMLLVALGGSGGASAQGKGPGFADAVITGLVQAALDSDPVLRHMDISIETHGRVVRLSGFVHSTAHVDRAEALARRVENVSAVRNEIRVADRPSRA